MHISNPQAHCNAYVVSRFRPDLLTSFSATVALVVFAVCCQPAFAQSIFGSIDPFSTSGKVAPAPNQRWIPEDALPLVTPPSALESIPADLNRRLALAELIEIALSLNVRTRQAWLQARVEAAQSGIDHAG